MSTSVTELDGATAPADMAPLLEIEDLTIDFQTDRGLLRVVDGVSFSIGRGELVGLAGESGSGKTLTALSILRLLPRRARIGGRISVLGRDVLSLSDAGLRSLRGREVAMVFQDPMSSLHPAWRVGTQISEAIRAHEDVSRAEAGARAVEMLDLVGISDPARRARQYPFELSGGMQQRAMIAMALAMRPALLVADEPTTALDVTVQAQIIELLQSLQQELGMAIVFVSHDLGLVARLCERVLVMYAGQVVEDSPVERIFARPSHPYSQALLAADLQPEHKGTRLATLPGFPPEPSALPPGCRFAPRCAHAVPECDEGVPPVEVTADLTKVRCIRHRELEVRGA
jgi:peptide/nickel transport system ATP-binding protein